jgi:hypothetical protein
VILISALSQSLDARSAARQYRFSMTGGPDSEQITLSLSLPEALTVVSALRQYQPYWLAAREADVAAELFPQTRLEIESVIAKLRVAASPAEGPVG